VSPGILATGKRTGTEILGSFSARLCRAVGGSPRGNTTGSPGERRARRPGM